MTPDGRSVAFSSKLPLTGYDSRGLPELFAYEYEAAVGSILCLV